MSEVVEAGKVRYLDISGRRSSASGAIDFVPYSDLGRGFLSGAGNPPTICSIREASVSKPHRPRPLGTSGESAPGRPTRERFPI